MLLGSSRINSRIKEKFEIDEIYELELWKIDQAVIHEIRDLCADISRKINGIFTKSFYY